MVKHLKDSWGRGTGAAERWRGHGSDHQQCDDKQLRSGEFRPSWRNSTDRRTELSRAVRTTWRHWNCTVHHHHHHSMPSRFLRRILQWSEIGLIRWEVSSLSRSSRRCRWNLDPSSKAHTPRTSKPLTPLICSATEVFRFSPFLLYEVNQ